MPDIALTRHYIHPRLSRLVTRGLITCVCGALVLVSGCKPEAAGPAVAKPAEVVVALPTEETVTEFEEVTGRTWATETNEIRARVSGYLDKVYFRDGAEVRPGDVLFEIDKRPYAAEAANASATVKQHEAHLERLVRQEERMKKLLPTKAISTDEYESITFELAETKAALAAARATEDLALLHLDYCRVTSRIGGTIGRRLVDPGNLVKADDTALATIVSINPIYAYFDLDERTVLRLRRMILEGKIQSPRDIELPADIAVADDPDYTLKGMINFIDNQLDGSTGTLRGRATIQNSNGLLSPGLFVRLRVPIGAPRKALMVREEALGSDQGQRFLYVVEKSKDKDTGEMVDTVSYRRVQVGILVGGKRVIESGIESGERVIVTGLQRVRPGAKVMAKVLEEPEKTVAESIETKAKVATSSNTQADPVAKPGTFESPKAEATPHGTSTGPASTIIPSAATGPALSASPPTSTIAHSESKQEK